MYKIKRLLSNINVREFKMYLFSSILLITILIFFGTSKFTQSKYENDTQINIEPSLAFFIVDVESTTGQIKLESMIPREQPYLYTFEVSNFIDNQRANVDLTYSIEIITTTNMPLNFRIYKGNTLEQNEIDSDTTTTDSNGVYYRHLVINDISVMEYSTNCTDTYTLWVEFPSIYSAYPDFYEGIIDLVDIKIDAEQVV